MADLFKYLGKRMDAHCREHVMDMMEMDEDDPDFKEEVESYKNLMEMTLYREQADIEVAYYMEIPKKVLNRFGYTNKQLDEDLENAGIDGGYPY